MPAGIYPVVSDGRSSRCPHITLNEPLALSLYSIIGFFERANKKIDPAAAPTPTDVTNPADAAPTDPTTLTAASSDDAADATTDPKIGT